MDDDFPAAHSMDTFWFAVDERGHVGVFISGEDGHLPQGAVDGALDLMDALDGGDEDVDEEWEDRAARLGLFCYSFNDFAARTVEPYARGASPTQPVHVDQLPPSLRERVRTICFKNIDFSQQELVQPLEQYPCDFWDEEYVVAYLGSDGRTIRPVPGKERLFADFCIDFHREHPKEAKKYIFKSLEKDPKGKRSAGNRNKKDDKDS